MKWEQPRQHIKLHYGQNILVLMFLLVGFQKVHIVRYFLWKVTMKKIFFQFSWCHNQLDKFPQGVILCSLRRKCFLLANLFLQMKIDQKPSAYLILSKFVKVLRKRLFLPHHDSHSFLETEIAFRTKKSQEFSHMSMTIIKISVLTIASFIVKNEIC